MPALSEAELIAAFAKFCQETDFYAGFEEMEPDLARNREEITPLIGSPEKAAAFEAFGLMGDGSYVAFWQPAGIPATQRLICYLDSEGYSWGVFAASFAEFLTLLPYGIIGLSATILFHCADLHRSPDSIPPLNVKELTERFVPMFTAEMAAECPSLPAYVEWLTQTAGLSVAARPVEQIIDAYGSHPNLDDWLDA